MEIEIRAYNKKDKYFDYFRSANWSINSLKFITDTWSIDLWTNQKDKFDRKIYENDIVRLPNGDECVIKYIDTRFEAISINNKFGIQSYVYWHGNCEIIGNIYESRMDRT